jgi:protein-S-isoprenylcysteine O-methyltransferase Ste14
MLTFRWIYRFRTYWACAPLLVALFTDYNEFEVHSLTWGLALGIFVPGMGIRVWAQQHLHHRLRVHKQLTETGPYQFVRNPLYIGNILICLSATIASELLWMIPITLFWCIGTYSLVIRYEESYLLQKYGDEFRRYLLTVPRWVPRLMLPGNLELKNRHWRRAVLVEFPNIFLLLPYAIKELLS